MESLLRQRAFVTVSEASTETHMTPAAASSQLEAAAAAMASEGAQVLYAVVSQQGCRGDQHVSLCCGRNNAEQAREGTAVTVFAAVLPHRGPATAHSGNKSAPTPTLRPKALVGLRPYPLVARETLEKETSSIVSRGPVEATVPRPAATSPRPTSEQSPRLPAVVHEAATAPSPAVAPQLHQIPSKTVEELPAPLPETPTVTTELNEATAVIPSVEVPPPPPVVPAASQEKRQPSLFEMMKAASANVSKQATSATHAGQKRARGNEQTKGDADGGEAKPSSQGLAVPKPKSTGRKTKVAKTESVKETKSLAKLAKASAKNRRGAEAGPAEPPAPKAMLGLLDDDEEPDKERDASTSTSAGRDDSNLPESLLLPGDARVSAEASVLDVTETLVNDDIIICDDAPPLVFLTPASPPVGQSAPGARSSETKGAGSQSSLSAFFSAEAVQFQKSYVRKLKTEMKKDANGEYNCVDVAYYEPINGSGECLSEDAYRRRAAELAKSHRASAAPPQSETPNRGEAGERVNEDESPEAADAQQKASKASKHSGRLLVAKVATPTDTTAAKPRTLMSFFKQGS